MPKRLDSFLFENGMLQSRSSAKAMILRGSVLVNGRVVEKPAFPVEESDCVTLSALPKYVGRGGEKLEKALQVFSVSPKGKTALDVGASTGGFTDCLLSHGAEKVFALDVGHGQLAAELAADARVVNLEGLHVKDLSFYHLENIVPSLITVDVSFISLGMIFPYLYPFSSPDTDMICLVKPQFEIGRSAKGFVRNKKDHVSVLNKVLGAAEENRFGLLGADFSPIRGGSGNIEFLFHLKRDAPSSGIDFEALVEAAHRESQG